MHDGRRQIQMQYYLRIIAFFVTLLLHLIEIIHKVVINN